MIIAGDLGGTKLDLALYSADQLDAPLAKKRYYTSDYRSLYVVLEDFRKKVAPSARVLSLGVAAPVTDGKVTLTNCQWAVSDEMIRGQGFDHVFLINDLAAQAYGLESLNPNNVVSLNNGVKRDGNRAIIAAGTGLGQSIFVLGPAETINHLPRKEGTVGLPQRC